MEPAGIEKGQRADAGHVRRQIPEVGQRGAGGEAAVADLTDVFAALDRAQPRTAAEYTVAKRDERIRQRHALERNAVAERAARQNADVLQVDRLEVGIAVLVVVAIGVAVGDRPAHLEHVVGQDHVRRAADADAVQGLIALGNGQILDLIAATETALGQHRRLRQSNVGQVGHIAELNVVDALRHGERGDAAAACRDDERFQPVGQDQLVHAVQIVLNAHHLRAGADGQLGGVLPALAAKKHAAAVELRPVGKPLIPLGGINAGQFHIAQRRREGEALDVRAVVKRGVLQRGQAVGQVQARQARALTESSVADDLQALVQRDGGQPRAAGKGTVVDARNAAGNVHGGQRRGLIKRGGADLPYARRNGHAGNIRAPEGVGADGLHGVGNDGRLALALIGEQLPLPDEEVRRTVVIKPIIVKRAELPGKGADAVGRPRTECPAVQERMLALEGDVGQIRARCKRSLADLRHARRNRNIFQIVVVVKRPLADGFQALRQHDLAQR